ncbi:hypothetical protein [Metallumcola ferriviriculae]
MRQSDIFWELFSSTGYIGAYLLYKDTIIGADIDYESVESSTGER